MTDLVHPCQILADVLTLQELSRFSSSTNIVFVGDGNNIVNSWLELAEKFPIYFVLSCPAGYEPHPQILEQAQAAAISKIEFIQDPMEAVNDVLDGKHSIVLQQAENRLHIQKGIIGYLL